MMDIKIRQYTPILLLGFFFLGHPSMAQEKTQINWLTFEQLSDSLAVQPKKVLISFHTDWCVYCRKMHNEVYTKPEVIRRINAEYYAVKFDAETEDDVVFEGQRFSNHNATSRRKGPHELALLLGSRPNHGYSVPVTVILDEQFQVLSRHFEYLSSKKLLKVL